MPGTLPGRPRGGQTGQVNRMTTAVPGGGVRVTRGVGGSLLALARAIAFLGSLLLGAVLLVVIAGSVALTVQALGHLVQDVLDHRSLGMGNG